MESWKFVHAADLHLDSALQGLENYEGAPLDRMRGATRRALENIVNLCIEEQVKFLILAGDIYDGAWKDFQTGLFFHGQMVRLNRENISVYMVRGNHDAQSVITKSLSLPPNVHEFGARKAESIVIDSLDVALHGQSFLHKSTTENLALGYPPAVPGYLNIGVLHTCLHGHSRHANYAPCTISDLEGKGYQYWALGHVHEQQVVSQDPWIVWSGTSQGRHAREVSAKGVMLVSASEGAVESVEFRPVDVVRWCRLECDVSGVATVAEIVNRVRDALLAAHEQSGGTIALAVRVHLRGRCQAHALVNTMAQRDAAGSEIRACANELNDEIWVEKIVFRTEPEMDLDALAGRDDAVGGFLRSLRDLQVDSDSRQELLALFGDLRSKIPAGALSEGDLLDFESAEGLRSLLTSVEALVTPMVVRADTEEEL